MSVKVKMLKTLNAKECLDDIKTLKNKKQLASIWFKELRDKICNSFEEIENNKSVKKQITFNQKSWERERGRDRLKLKTVSAHTQRNQF